MVTNMKARLLFERRVVSNEAGFAELVLWEVPKQGPITLRDAARRVGRDVRAVHGDAHALFAAGILRKTTDGKIEFPYDAVHVDFVLRAVA